VHVAFNIVDVFVTFFNLPNQFPSHFPFCPSNVLEFFDIQDTTSDINIVFKALCNI